MKLNFLFDEVFRASKQYNLVEANQIRQSGHHALTDVFADDDIFGIFVPTAPNTASSYKIAYKDIALLYFFLQKKGKLPLFIQNDYDDDINRIVAKLVLEGIFEIEWQGKFISGAAAQVALYERIYSANTSPSHIINISAKAIQYGLLLQDIDTRSLATKMYCYNTLPASEAYFANLTDSLAVERFLAINDSSQKKNLRGWTKQAPSSKFSWLSWFRNDSTIKSDYLENATYKIYISPTIEVMPEAFASFLGVLPKTNAFSFKVGTDRQGLLRPDKWVVYFGSHADLLDAAQQFELVLAKFPVQGVPFTAPLDAKGLLSWGIDPPRNEVMKDIEGGSWRASVSDKIAIAIGQATSEKIASKDAFDFVMNKLFLENIDAANWTPIQPNLF